MKLEFNVEDFKKKFPHLYREIVEGKMTIRVGFRRELETKMPTAIDYLRRCDTDEQGREVINYLLKRGEISQEEAERLMKQLEAEGIRSFGSRKTLGHYFREPL